MSAEFKTIERENGPTSYAFGDSQRAVEFVPEYKGHPALVLRHYAPSVYPEPDQYEGFEPKPCTVLGGPCCGDYSYLLAEEIDTRNERAIEVSLRVLFSPE